MYVTRTVAVWYNNNFEQKRRQINWRQHHTKRIHTNDLFIHLNGLLLCLLFMQFPKKNPAPLSCGSWQKAIESLDINFFWVGITITVCKELKDTVQCTRLYLASPIPNIGICSHYSNWLQYPSFTYRIISAPGPHVYRPTILWAWKAPVLANRVSKRYLYMPRFLLPCSLQVNATPVTYSWRAF